MARSESVNVLIVDDDRATQRMLADALHKQGFIVTVERDGEWALKTFEKKSFDAVLLDLLLPALNGYEVARKMRMLPKGKRTPIIMLSGVYKNALHQREAVEKHGAFAFLEKPMKLQALYGVLQEALGDRYPSAPKPKPPPPPVEDDEVTGEYLADTAAREEKTTVEVQAKTVSKADVQAVRGDLKTRSFPEVLAEIQRWKGTGALLLRRQKVKKIVYFRDGTPRSIKSNLLGECLGRVMVREKMISEAECEESLTRMKSSQRQQGTVLIEMGCISPHNLQYALVLQLQTKLFDVFSWTEGDYQFNPKVAPPPEAVEVGMTTAQVIYEGIKRSYDASRLLKVMGDGAGLYVHPSEHPLQALQEIDLSDDEVALMQAADGHKTVGTLRALALLPAMETDRLLFAMTCAQLIELKAFAASGKPRASLFKLATEKPAEKPPVPSALPPPLKPKGPPPLPARAPVAPPSAAVASKATAPGLPLPWEDARVSQSLQREGPPPPPPDASPPPRPSGRRRGKGKDAEKPSAAEAPVLARSASSLLPELSAVIPASRLSSDESLIRERLAGKVAAMRKLDHFEVLGLPTTANREDVKRAYFALAKEYHPDKHFSSASAELRQLAQEIYDLISTAHDTLADPVERERYLKELASGIKREVGDEVGKILAAEGKFQKGEELMRKRNFPAAHQLFREAVALYADEGEFHAWLGWSLFQMDSSSPAAVDEALASLEKSIALNPRLDKGYLFLGYLHKATGRPDKAEKQFEKAIQANPDCNEALRELRLLGKARR